MKNLKMKRISLGKILVLFMLLFVGVIASSCTIGSDVLDGLVLSSVTVKGESSINIGSTFTAKAQITPATDEEPDFIWSTTNESVIVVDSEGVVTGVGVGTASVIATSADNENLFGRLFVKVFAKEIEYSNEPPTSIALIGDTSAKVNTIGYYRVKTTPENASQDIKFKSSNEEVATVDTLGIVSFKNKGSVIITAYSALKEEVTASININVDSKESGLVEDSTIEVIKNTKDSILGVANYQYNTKGVLVKNSIGSGFVYNVYGVLENEEITDDLTDEKIVSYEHYLITNKHVIDGSDELKVYLHTIDEEIPATLVHYDDKVDLAIVKFTYTELIKPLKFADSSTLEHGETVIAIGNPEGFEYSSSATRGIVSYPERYISDDTDGDGVNDWDAVYIQHDASINPGNSGGPLLNLFGEVVGINTLKFATIQNDNMGFSVPSNTIVELLPYLEKEKVPVRAKIGITVISLTDLLASDYEAAEYKYIIPEDVKQGLYITDVTVGSVSDGKLQKDDILLEFNGITLRKSIQLRAQLNSIVVGSETEIVVKVRRNGEVLDITLIF